MKLYKKLTKIKRRIVSSCLVGALAIGSTVPVAAAPDGPMSITYYDSDYEYQKMEPQNGTYLGAYVIQDDYINQDMNTFNELTEKKHASFFRYVGYGRPFPTEWVEEVKAVGAVPHIAFEPNGGLEKVQDDEYLRQWARDAAAADVPIYIRWASEMNGTWTQYSGQSELYKEKWKLVYNVFKEEAPNCSFVWTVFTFPENTIEEFYPGDEYVDWVGVNIYNVMYHNDKITDKAEHEDPLELLDYVYNTYSYRKPIQISEYGATHYTVTDNSNHSEWAASKISRLYENIETYYPRVKSIFYFDVNNLNTYNEERRINDYSITDDPIVLEAYKKAVSSKNFLSTYKENPVSVAESERMTYNGFTKVYDGRLHAPTSFFADNLGLKVTKNSNGMFTVSNGKKSVQVKAQTYNQRTNFGIRRTHTMLPVTTTLKALGYTVYTDANKNMLYVIEK